MNESCRIGAASTLKLPGKVLMLGRTRKLVLHRGPRHIARWQFLFSVEDVWKGFAHFCTLRGIFASISISLIKSVCFDLNMTSCNKERFARSSTRFTSFWRRVLLSFPSEAIATSENWSRCQSLLGLVPREVWNRVGIPDKSTRQGLRGMCIPVRHWAWAWAALLSRWQSAAMSLRTDLRWAQL